MTRARARSVALAALFAPVLSGCGCGGGGRDPGLWVFGLDTEPAPMVALLDTFGETYWIWFDTDVDMGDFDGDGMLDDVRETLLVVATDVDDLCDRLANGPLDTVNRGAFVKFEAFDTFIDGAGAIGSGSTVGGGANTRLLLDMQYWDGGAEVAVQAYDDSMGVLSITTIDETLLVGTLGGGRIAEAYDGRRWVPVIETPYTADFLAVPRCDGLL